MTLTTFQLGKPLGRISAVQMDFVQIAFQPPPSSKRTLWGYFFRRKLVNFFKTLVLTMGIDILTMTMVKHYSLVVF